MNADNEERQSGGDRREWNRPRRPNADTVGYLSSLPMLATQGDEGDSISLMEANLAEISQFQLDYYHQTLRKKTQGTNAPNEEQDLEFPSCLAAALSALSEVRREVASLAGDERAGQALEVLIKLTAPFSASAARAWLSACVGYIPHLAAHRYGSHILQTILEHVFLRQNRRWTQGPHQNNTAVDREEWKAAQQVDLALHEDAPSIDPWAEDAEEFTVGDDKEPSPDALLDLLLEWQQELLPQADSFTGHFCATHVLRSIFLILGGIQLQQPSQKSSFRGGRRRKQHSSPDANDVPSPRSLTQIEAIDNPWFPNTKEHQKKMAHVLKEWTHAIVGSGKTTGSGPLQQLACDASGGPLLIVLLRALVYRDATIEGKAFSADLSLDASSPQQNHALPTIVKEPHFESTSAACFLAKSILCWDDILPQGESKGQSAMGNTIYSLAGDVRGSHVLDSIVRLCPDDMYESILQEGQFLTSLQDYVEHNVSNFVIQTFLATARKETQAQAMGKACLPLIENGLIVDATKRRRGVLWRLAEMALRFRDVQPDIVNCLLVWKNQVAPALLGVQRKSSSSGVGGRHITVNVEGTRALHYFLQFDEGKENDKHPIIESLFALPSDDLAALAQDGLSSRCVWDALFLPSIYKRSCVVKARTRLVKHLRGKWTMLATDRIGHHMVIKLFRSFSDIKLREVLTEELSQEMYRLKGNNMGRSVVKEFELNTYTYSKSDWTKMMQNQMDSQQWFQDEIMDKKPKRKSISGSTVSSSCSDAKRSKTIVTTSVDSIFDALTIPKKQKKCGKN